MLLASARYQAIYYTLLNYSNISSIMTKTVSLYRLGFGIRLINFDRGDSEVPRGWGPLIYPGKLIFRADFLAPFNYPRKNLILSDWRFFSMSLETVYDPDTGKILRSISCQK